MKVDRSRRHIRAVASLTAVWVIASVVPALSGTLASPASASPGGLTVSPTVGPPTKTITLQGTGFGTAEAVDVYFEATDVALVTTDGSGGFTASARVPASAKPGKHSFSAVGRRTGTALSASFLVPYQ